MAEFDIKEQWEIRNIPHWLKDVQWWSALKAG